MLGASKKEGLSGIDQASTIASLSTGMILTIIRLSEPYMIFLIKKSVCGWFGDPRYERNEQAELDDTLNFYLLQSLNVELVHIILKGIVKFQKVGHSNIDPQL